MHSAWLAEASTILDHHHNGRTGFTMKVLQRVPYALDNEDLQTRGLLPLQTPGCPVLDFHFSCTQHGNGSSADLELSIYVWIVLPTHAYDVLVCNILC